MSACKKRRDDRFAAERQNKLQESSADVQGIVLSFLELQDWGAWSRLNHFFRRRLERWLSAPHQKMHIPNVYESGVNAWDIGLILKWARNVQRICYHPCVTTDISNSPEHRRRVLYRQKLFLWNLVKNNSHCLKSLNAAEHAMSADVYAALMSCSQLDHIDEPYYHARTIDAEFAVHDSDAMNFARDKFKELLRLPSVANSVRSICLRSTQLGYDLGHAIPKMLPNLTCLDIMQGLSMAFAIQAIRSCRKLVKLRVGIGLTAGDLQLEHSKDAIYRPLRTVLDMHASTLEELKVSFVCGSDPDPRQSSMRAIPIPDRPTTTALETTVYPKLKSLHYDTYSGPHDYNATRTDVTFRFDDSHLFSNAKFPALTLLDVDPGHLLACSIVNQAQPSKLNILRTGEDGFANRIGQNPKNAAKECITYFKTLITFVELHSLAIDAQLEWLFAGGSECVLPGNLRSLHVHFRRPQPKLLPHAWLKRIWSRLPHLQTCWAIQSDNEYPNAADLKKEAALGDSNNITLPCLETLQLDGMNVFDSASFAGVDAPRLIHLRLSSFAIACPLQDDKVRDDMDSDVQEMAAFINRNKAKLITFHWEILDHTLVELWSRDFVAALKTGAPPKTDLFELYISRVKEIDVETGRFVKYPLPYQLSRTKLRQETQFNLFVMSAIVHVFSLQRLVLKDFYLPLPVQHGRWRRWHDDTTRWMLDPAIVKNCPNLQRLRVVPALLRSSDAGLVFRAFPQLSELTVCPNYSNDDAQMPHNEIQHQEADVRFMDAEVYQTLQHDLVDTGVVQALIKIDKNIYESCRWFACHCKRSASCSSSD